MVPPPNLALVGPMGAGKSSVAPLLARLYGLRPVDTDAQVEHAAGRSVAAIFARDGEAGFRRLEQEALGQLLAGHGQVLATGGGVIVEAANRRLLRQRAFVVHLHATADEQLARLQGDASRPLLQHADPAGRLRQLAIQRDPLYAEVADLRVPTGGLSPEQVATQVHERLAGLWQPGAPA